MTEQKQKKTFGWLIYWVADWYGKQERSQFLFSVEAATENEAIDAGYEKSGKPRTAKLIAKKMGVRERARTN